MIRSILSSNRAATLAPSTQRILRARDTSAPLKSAIRKALLGLGSGESRELVAKALWKALTDHEREHPTT
jgi:hypothetical protein